MEEALSRSHHTWALDVEPADLGFTFLQRRRTYRISVDKRLEMICNPVELYAAVKAAFAGKMPKVSFGILQGVFATRADLKAAVREALRAKCTCGNAQVCGCTFEGQLADGQRSSLQAFRGMYRAKFKKQARRVVFHLNDNPRARCTWSACGGRHACDVFI